MAVKLRSILLALVIGFVGFAVPAAGQRGGRGASGGGYGPLGVPSSGTDTAGNKYADYLYGVVRVLDEDQMILTKTKVGPDQTFKFNKKTKFIRDGKEGSFKSLKVGDEVWVDADEDKKTGNFIARKVVSGVFTMPSS
ncbi:MAG: hypothetical protein WAO35_11385 [Terriglobia bacterium]